MQRTFATNPAAVAALTPEQYRVTQREGTEAPITGQYRDGHEPGLYVDVVSGEPLRYLHQFRVAALRRGR